MSDSWVNPDSGRKVGFEGAVGKRLLLEYGREALEKYTMAYQKDKNAPKPRKLGAGAGAVGAPAAAAKVKVAAKTAATAPAPVVAVIRTKASIPFPQEEWTDAQLEAYVKGELRPLSPAELEKMAGSLSPRLLQRIFRLEHLPSCWKKPEAPQFFALLSKEYNTWLDRH